MNLKPLNDWAVIRPSEPEARTAGGLYIPDSAKDKPHEGVVEAIGPGAYEEEKPGAKKDKQKERRFVPTTVKPGDRALYEQYAGRSYKIDGEELVLVRERDILGILPERQSKPLQIPAVTSATGSTSVVPRSATKKEAEMKGKQKPASAPKKSAEKTAAKKKPGKKK
ncbi:MAG TPA: co-chaperone GroES [Nitrospirota bacterium]